MDLSFTLERCDETTGEESVIELLVNGEYEGEVPDEPWGYYGATPGMAENAYITSLSLRVEVAGPHKYPYARGPVVYEVPWEGTLTKNEELRICCELVNAAREEVASARESAAVDAYEARNDSSW